MDAREVMRIAGQVFDARKYEIRTHIIAQVSSYDAAKNTVTVQPVTKAVRFTDAENLTTVQLPQISEVPVLQTGSGKVWCTVAPAVGSYGLLHVSDRTIGDWMAAGGIVEPSEIRCHDKSDAIFEPSMLHLVEEGDSGAFAEPIKTDRISLRTRSGLTEISVLDDESVEVNVNDGKATIIIDVDGNVSITAAGNLDAEVDGDATLTATSVTLDGNPVQAGTGTDFVALAKVTDDKIQAIADAIANAAVTPMDGGAAFKAAIVATLSVQLPLLGTVASSNLKADG